MANGLIKPANRNECLFTQLYVCMLCMVLRRVRTESSTGYLAMFFVHCSIKSEAFSIRGDKMGWSKLLDVFRVRRQCVAKTGKGN